MENKLSEFLNSKVLLYNHPNFIADDPVCIPHKFKKQQEVNELESKKFKAITEYKDNLVFNSLPYEISLMEKDTLLKEKRVRWHESLSKDAYVEEALNILGDLQSKSVVKSQTPVKTKKGKLVGSL